ncbi:hypothetical protein [Desertivirga xinjiangensis]|uniref:hypothetical protein n=1 Tax=Desertivirga xinjiangensis TaxID=539206 RepID=UPI00210C39CA|nr:hypothetical protein [Pedobacter xinjiangensis]
MFLKLVEKHLLKPDLQFEPAYRNEVLELLKLAGNSDIFSLSFIAWLIAKWEKKTPYEVVLRLIEDKDVTN